MDSFPPYNKIDHPAMPKSHLNSLLIILIITFLASGATLIVLRQIYQYDGDQVYIATQAALPFHKSVPEKSSAANTGKVEGESMESLQAYSNQEYGFEFNYPQSWKLESHDNIVSENIGNSTDDIVFQLNLITGDSKELILFLRKSLGFEPGFGSNKFVEYEVGGNKTKMYFFPNGYECYGQAVTNLSDCAFSQMVINHNKFWYDFGFMGIGSIDELQKSGFLTILSTFKFTN